jgi:hypothetical protein
MIPATTRPKPGFYRARMVRGGPMLPIVIWAPCPLEYPRAPAAKERPATLRKPRADDDIIFQWIDRGRSQGYGVPLFADVNGTHWDVRQLWDRIWMVAEPISEADYWHRRRVGEWSEIVGAPQERPFEKAQYSFQHLF